MTAITYTAKRYLAPSHAVDTQYGIDVGMSVINDDEEKHNKKQHRSLSGKTETWLSHIDRYISFQTVPIYEGSTLYLEMREFLSSVGGGETFTMDPWGTVAVPNNPVLCILDRISPAQRVSTLLYKKFSFRIRIVQ